jgi:hypothetical protein
VVRPDWFVLTTEAAGRRGYSRYARGPAGPVGFTFTYPVASPAASDEGDRLSVAIANAFEPDAAAAATPRPVAVQTIAVPGAVQGATSGAVPGAAPGAVPGGASGVAPGAGSGGAPAAAAVPAAATGLVVAPGRVVTVTAALASCRAATVAGRPATVAATTGGAVLLAVDGLAAAAAPGPVATAPAAGAETVALMRVAVSGRPAELTASAATTLGEGADLRLMAPAAPGAPGAAVLDRRGRLVGLLAGPTRPVPALAGGAGGVAPQVLQGLVPAADVAGLIAGAGLAAPAVAPDDGPVRTVGDLAAGYGASVVAVGCGATTAAR